MWQAHRSPSRPLWKVVKVKSKLQWRSQEGDYARAKRYLEGNRSKESLCVLQVTGQKQ